MSDVLALFEMELIKPAPPYEKHSSLSTRYFKIVAICDLIELIGFHISQINR